MRIFVRFLNELLLSHERSTHGKERAEVPKIFPTAFKHSRADRGEDRRAELLVSHLRYGHRL